MNTECVLKAVNLDDGMDTTGAVVEGLYTAMLIYDGNANKGKLF
jgi:hypothetical protein